MKIVLVNILSDFLEDPASYPPTGLMYIASAISSLGHEVAIMEENEAYLLNEWFLPADVDLYGISMTTPGFYSAIKFIRRIPPDIPVIIGGPHPSFLPLSLFNDEKVKIRFKSGMASMVIGEGEESVKMLIREIEKYKMFLSYSKTSGCLSPEDIPIPKRDLITHSRYRHISLHTTRGCPYSCSFCSKIGERSFTEIPIEKVIEDLDQISYFISKQQQLVIGDDDFGLRNRNSIFEIALNIYSKNIPFRVNMSARTITTETIETLKFFGCNEISFGVESGSQEILDLMSKRVTVSENSDSIKMVKDKGIKARIYLISNFPGETEKTIEQTLEFVRSTGPDSVLISNFVPLPGSEVFSNPEKFGITWTSPDWSRYYTTVGHQDYFDVSFKTNYLTPKKQNQLHKRLKEGLHEQGY